MRLSIITPILLTVSFSLAEAGPNRKSNCPAEREAQMDLCAASLVFIGDHSFRTPKNSNDSERFCSKSKSTISCIQSYSRECLQGFTKQIVTTLMKRGKQQSSSLCSQEGRRTFRKKLSCVTDDKIEQLHRLGDATIVRFEYISSKVKHDDKLPSVCCSTLIFNRDLEITLNNICGQSTTSTHDYIRKLVSETTSETLNLICENFRSFEDCRKSSKTSGVLKILEEESRKVAEGKLKPKSKSILPVLLQILDSSETNR